MDSLLETFRCKSTQIEVQSDLKGLLLDESNMISETETACNQNLQIYPAWASAAASPNSIFHPRRRLEISGL